KVPVALPSASSAGSPISSSRFVAAWRVRKSELPSCLTRRAISLSSGSSATAGTNGRTNKRPAKQRVNQVVMFGSLRERSARRTPDAGGAIQAGGGDALAVGEEGNADHVVVVA